MSTTRFAIQRCAQSRALRQVPHLTRLPSRHVQSWYDRPNVTERGQTRPPYHVPTQGTLLFLNGLLGRGNNVTELCAEPSLNSHIFSVIMLLSIRKNPLSSTVFGALRNLDAPTMRIICPLQSFPALSSDTNFSFMPFMLCFCIRIIIFHRAPKMPIRSFISLFVVCMMSANACAQWLWAALTTGNEP